MRTSNINIKMPDFNLIQCLNFDCVHNQVNHMQDDFGCNLKIVSIDAEGKCESFAEKRKKNG